MIQINPLKSYIDGGVRAALTTPPSASLVFDLPGKAIWVKGVKLKGTDHTYIFNHDNYITLTNTPDSNESEDIKIGVNITTLKNAIDTTYNGGTLALLQEGLNTEERTWQAKILHSYINNVLPVTKNLKINGTNYAIYTTADSLPQFFAPVSLGTTGQILACTSSGLIWIDQIQNTDYRVSQSSATSNSDYRIILKQGVDNNPETDFVRFSEYLTFNPYTKILKINNIKVVTATDIYTGSNAGLVPAATSAQQNYYLRGDGTWVNIATEMAAVNTWRPIKVGNTDALGSGTNTGTLSFIAGTGIALSWDATNKRIIITNSSPDVNHNTDETVRQVPKTDDVNRPLMMINGSTSAGEQINTSMFSTSIYANASTKMITANGFIKAGSSNSYVLLGGGGHKLISDFAASYHNHYRIKLSDDRAKYPGQLTGNEISSIFGGFMQNSTLGIYNFGDYSDVLVIRSYTDSSGGNDNAIIFNKNTRGVWHTQFGFGSTTSWGTPYLFLDSNNFNKYTPTLTGIGANGTWEINITGNAATATNADKLDGIDSTGFLRYYNSNVAPSNVDIVNTPSYVWTVSTTGGSVSTVTKPSGIDNAWGVIHLHTHSGNYATQLGFGGTTNRMYMRNAYNSSTFDNWQALAFTSDIPTVTDYYWANVKVSASSNASTNPTFNTCYTDNWFRSRGQTGWYNESYGGGINMIDSTWVRIYNDKKFYVNNSEYDAIHSAGGVYVAGMIHAYANYLKSTCNGKYVTIGPQNSSHAHYETDATVSHWFNKRVDVNGAIWRYGTNYGIDSDGYFYAKGVYANRDGASTYGGVSLYSTSDPITEYGITFRGTGNYGKIGKVQGDWATYFTMDSSYNRGWIFRSGGINYASISARGEAYFSTVGTDNYIAYPSGGFFSSNGSTGYIIITIPANYRSCTMMRFNVEIYNYSEGTSTTYTIGGYNYDDGNWYNVFAYANRQGTTGYGNLTVRFGHNGTNSIIWIGESNTSYSYPKVRITNVTLGHSNTDYNTWAVGWSVTIATTAPTNVSQIVINPATNYYAQIADVANSVAWSNVSGRPTNVSSFTNDAGYLTSHQSLENCIKNAGNNPTLGNGGAIIQPGGGNPISIRTTTGGSDVGIFYMSEDNCYICNSSDNYYTFGVFDKDLTTAMNDPNAASFCVLSNGAGCRCRGDFTAAGQFYANSDIRYKTIQQNVLQILHKLSEIPLFTYYWKDTEHDKQLHIGSSAQAVQKVLPQLVTYEKTNDFYSLDYATLGTIAGITACKELVTQKSELQELKEKVKQLEDKLRKYENIL